MKRVSFLCTFKDDYNDPSKIESSRASWTTDIVLGDLPCWRALLGVTMTIQPLRTAASWLHGMRIQMRDSEILSLVQV